MAGGQLPAEAGLAAGGDPARGEEAKYYLLEGARVGWILGAAMRCSFNGKKSLQHLLRRGLMSSLPTLVACAQCTLVHSLLPPSCVQPDEEGEEAAEFDMGWLGDFIDRVSDFDREMNGVVVESGEWGVGGGEGVAGARAHLPPMPENWCLRRGVARRHPGRDPARDAVADGGPHRRAPRLPRLSAAGGGGGHPHVSFLFGGSSCGGEGGVGRRICVSVPATETGCSVCIQLARVLCWVLLRSVLLEETRVQTSQPTAPAASLPPLPPLPPFLPGAATW